MTGILSVCFRFHTGRIPPSLALWVCLCSQEKNGGSAGLPVAFLSGFWQDIIINMMLMMMCWTGQAVGRRRKNWEGPCLGSMYDIHCCSPPAMAVISAPPLLLFLSNFLGGRFAAISFIIIILGTLKYTQTHSSTPNYTHTARRGFDSKEWTRFVLVYSHLNYMDFRCPVGGGVIVGGLDSDVTHNSMDLQGYWTPLRVSSLFVSLARFLQEPRGHCVFCLVFRGVTE